MDAKQPDGAGRFSPAQAYWGQRLAIANARRRILELSQAVNHPSDLWPFQFAQLMSAALDYTPDLVVELGRGYGNSTCAFTEAANQRKEPSRVLSLCLSEDWERSTVPRLRRMVPDSWFLPLEAWRTNILSFDFHAALAGARRVLLFWDAHGFAVAECVLGAILPELSNREHLVIMHDLSDNRYSSPDSLQYGDHGVWKSMDDAGPRLKLGIIDSAVEQAITILDFATRNQLTLDSADHSLRTELARDAEKMSEMRDRLGDDLFNLQAHWFYFSLNEHSGPYTFPRFTRMQADTDRGPQRAAPSRG